MKSLSWRLVLVIAVIVAAIVYLLPTLNPFIWPHKQINLGLDLQGGMHLVLEVETEKAVESNLERIYQDIRQLVRKERIRGVRMQPTGDGKIDVSVEGADQIAAFKKLLSNELNSMLSKIRIDGAELLELSLFLESDEVDHIKRLAVDQALETIRNRIDQFGVAEPDIRLQGDNRILIQLPGIKDTERAKGLIGKTALLEFKLVDDTGDVNAAIAGSVPPGRQVLYREEVDSQTDASRKIPYLLKKRAVLTGASLTDARVQIDSQYNEPYVSIEFDKKGARIFERVTEENVGKSLAIVLDDNVASAPVIQEKISGGQARITGQFDMEEARDLAIVLRAGALPAPVKILEERTVGPSLGADSIRYGLISMLIGGICVVVFMVIYYKGAGLIANFALLLNILLIAAGLSAIQATLTLPGIAGIILTIGMAVDANVIIFERIREELALGRTPFSAVDAGFKRATLTILDANVTTLIAAVVLYQFGTGAIRGFAVTLSLGVVASMFTALILARMIFDSILKNRKVRTLSI